MRQRLIALPLAVLASLALASAALAGGWALVSVQNAPLDPPAGEETTIGLTVHQHGETPVSWPTLTVVATDAVSGAVVRSEAQAEGPEGSYVATIVFPTAGEWTLTFESAELVMEGSIAMSVAQPVAAAQSDAAAATAAAAANSTFDTLPVLLLIGAAIIVLAIAGLTLRSRGQATTGTREGAYVP